jgi:ketosteroid isomerase-like protein
MTKHEADVAAIRELVAGAAELMKARDFDSIAAAYASTGKLLLPGQPAASGYDEIRAAWAGFVGAMPGLELDYGPIAIEVAEARDVAIELGRYALSYDGPAGRIHDQGKYVVTWKNEGGVWKLDLDILNSDLAAPQA